MNMAAFKRLLGVLLLALSPGHVTAVEADTFSKVVSYQFQDSLADPEAQTPIISRVVSYQYFDWPGDENLTFQYAPSVSYYFGGGVSLFLTGSVKDTDGIPVVGAAVILKRQDTVFWQGATALDGGIPSATLPSGNFNVIVIKEGYTSLFQSVSGDAGGPVSLDLTLVPALDLPTLTSVSRSPDATAIRQPSPPDPALARPSSFKVFSGSGFSADAPIYPSRMTIVISHGWNPDGGQALASWATTLAYQIYNHHALGGNAPNIIGWDWSERAHTSLPPVDEACYQGEYLGQALHKLLGSGYSQRIHFIGHSLGTIVNAYACDYVHGSFLRDRNNPAIHWDRNLTQPHITLLDEGEVSSVFGQSVVTASAIGWKVAQVKGALIAGTATAIADWKNPIPNSATWTDNYISLVGIQRKDAVNVVLPAMILSYNPGSGFPGLDQVHGYSHLWYQNTIQPTGAAPMVGFGRSFEKALAFPPGGAGLSSGSVWVEDLDTPDLLDLKRDPLMELNLKLPKSLSVLAASPIGAATIGTVDIIGQGVLDSYEAKINWLGDLGGTAIFKTGQVVAATTEKVGNLWDAAWDKASTINPDTLFTGNISTASLRLLLSTPSQGASMRSPRSSQSPPQAWFPIQVPDDAAFLVFDFTVTGDPVDDQIVCAINEQNLFTLPARFAPDGSPVSTDSLDISAYAGQQVEVYFGLVGGTSSGCTLAIDGLRFVTIPTPKLAATVVGDQVRLNWPAAAAGWILQRNSGLAPENWEDVTLPEALTTEDGVVTFDRQRSLPSEFFRLRRAE